MKKDIWRVEWLIDHGKGPKSSLELPSEKSAIEWAEGIQKHGGTGIVVTELIVGRTLHFANDHTLFEK